MDFVIVTVITGIVVFIIHFFVVNYLPSDLPSIFNRLASNENPIFHQKEIMKVLLGLDDEKLDELLELYKQEFGKGAAKYARKTYRKWESGKVKPISQTFERFLVHLPKVMDFDLKCEVLRHLMEEYCAKDNYDLEIYTDDWEKTLEPLVQKLIDKPYNANLPKQIEDKLSWLADDDMQIAEDCKGLAKWLCFVINR